jgi:predicted negative regulator of RcsB-dependent stress response
MISSIIIIILFVAIGYLYWQNKKKLEKYSAIIDLELEVEKIKKQIDKTSTEFNNLRSEYKTKLQIMRDLEKELKKVEEEYELTSYGFYKPTYLTHQSDISRNSTSSKKSKNR